MVETDNTYQSKTYQAYYTKSNAIVRYMIDRLDVSNNDYVLEPSGGDGVFIDELLQQHSNQKIDIYELDEGAISTLKEKYTSHPNIKIFHSDTLFDTDLMLKSSSGGFYDKIIANPPYGAWQTLKKRKNLKKIFHGFYVKETYTLFLYRCIELLKEGGELVFIIPDTYLNLHRHKQIREIILTQTEIKEIALFPSSFFPNVNFGYANLSIIHLKKSYSKSNLDNIITIKTDYSSVEQLGEKPNKTYTFSQKNILKNPDAAFYLVDEPKILNALQDINLTIGEIADCVTGFYSGNDKQFLKVKSKSIRNSKKYGLIDLKKINKSSLNREKQVGLSTEKCFVPIVKGGNKRYYKSNDWFMDWSAEAVNHYKIGKKARFQNSQFYFQQGVGVPMVSSSSITASLIDNRLFDQSIVGVFPKDKNLLYYLLGFFNTPTCNKLIRTINPSANNPANYIKKIPIIVGTQQEIEYINDRVIQIIENIKQVNTYNPMLEKDIINYFKNKYKF